MATRDENQRITSNTTQLSDVVCRKRVVFSRNEGISKFTATVPFAVFVVGRR